MLIRPTLTMSSEAALAENACRPVKKSFGPDVPVLSCRLPLCWRSHAKIATIVGDNIRFGTTGGDLVRLWRHGMSNTQSQTPQPRALHHRAAPTRSGSVAADLLQKFGRVARGQTDRPEFIEQNHGVRSAQSKRHNRRARDLLLIPCRFSGAKINAPTVG
jgi:hypothetical protein